MCLISGIHNFSWLGRDCRGKQATKEAIVLATPYRMDGKIIPNMRLWCRRDRTGLVS